MSVASRIALTVVLTVLLVLAVAGSSQLSGPVLWGFGDTTHGVHATDVVACALWAGGVVLTWRR